MNTKVASHFPGTGICPNCGHCPNCGRVTQPYNPWRPLPWNPYPPQPVWYGTTTTDTRL